MITRWKWLNCSAEQLDKGHLLQVVLWGGTSGGGLFQTHTTFLCLALFANGCRNDLFSPDSRLNNWGCYFPDSWQKSLCLALPVSQSGETFLLQPSLAKNKNVSS